MNILLIIATVSAYILIAVLAILIIVAEVVVVEICFMSEWYPVAVIFIIGFIAFDALLIIMLIVGTSFPFIMPSVKHFFGL